MTRGRSKPHHNFNRQREADRFHVIIDAQELEKHTLLKTRNIQLFPKKDRGGLPNVLFREAADLCADVMDANDLDINDVRESKERLYMQRSALRNVRRLIHHIELAHEVFDLSDSEFEYWSTLAESVRNEIAGWYKKDKQRAACNRDTSGKVL